MKTCKYCGKPIEWEQGPRGLRPVNADGSLHHRTCKPFQKTKALERRQAHEARLAYGLAAAPVQDIPGQMLFNF